MPPNDQVKLWQEFDLTLWYRPIEALKFGLQYSYERTNFLQNLNNPSLGAANTTAVLGVNGSALRGGFERGRIAPHPVRRPNVLLT